MTSGYTSSSGGLKRRASYDLPKERTGEYSSALSLTVLFTTESGTFNAVCRAAQLAHQLGANIQILLAQVVPYPLPIDKPQIDPEFRLRQFRTFCEQESVEIQIDIRLCRDPRQCVHDALRPHSVILIGGRQSWWPLTFEKRWARRLRRGGHQVIFVGHHR